ncbi:MAG: aminotransferase class V-fold PLP-dependent enzyme [Thermoplasmatota archaeon]
MLDAAELRKDFPLLARDDAPVFFDNACMTLKPRSVIDAVSRYYTDTPFCAGRSVYEGARAVETLVEDARARLARFLGAQPTGVVWTKNATEAINLVARTFPFKRRQVVLTSDREHNSNLVPWQLLAARGIKHEIFKTQPDGSLDAKRLARRLRKGDVALVAAVHESNLDGVTLPADAIVAAAHEEGVPVLLDGAQAAPHQPVDLSRLGADFYAVSLHKMLAPTGVGALVARPDALARLPPFLVGGDTVAHTTYDAFEMLDAPKKFEAGLQNYAGLAGVSPALEMLESIGMANVAAHERALATRIADGLADVDGLVLLGPSRPAGGIVSFTTPWLDAHALAILLDDKYRIWVRSGDHCAHSWLNAHKLEGSTRASLYLYNTREEADRFVEAVKEIAVSLKGATRRAPAPVRRSRGAARGRRNSAGNRRGSRARR